MKLIQLKKLSVNYKYKNIFENLSLTINAGEIITILGPNGAGKTTLIKTMAGLHKPLSGSITKSKKLRVSYIPQHLGLVKSKTVLHNILLGSLPELSFLNSLFLKFNEEQLNRAYSLAKEFKLDQLLIKKCYQLSGGEKRRVAIARALMTQPNLLLADEILSDLDFLKSKLIVNKLKNLQKQGLAIVLIEHDLCLAKDISSKMYLLNKGKLTDNFDPKEISDLKLCKLFK
jgi:ABC-type Mn2+/Zn2+ transport system ATPase subunit